MIPGSKGEPPGSPATSGSQTRSQDLKENLWVPLRPSGPFVTSGLRKQSPDSKSPYSKNMKPPGSRPISQILAVTPEFLGYLLIPAKSGSLPGSSYLAYGEDKGAIIYYESHPNRETGGEEPL
ncbi:hypothetical protein DY000_02007863 [Brassica cretica]|uniref:Uncharacterized protein n=1 Tax=Brassica cretica TaxID=69181 RepID=A0ABQ7BY69_BRACR|nr:hypothetical protein DY000_02007863 [Brassica cretica]